MRRFQAIEFEDYSWFPQPIRNYMTDFFQFQMARFNLYSPAASLLAKLLNKAGEKSIVDLCSGGSGPLALLQQQLKDEHDLDVPVTLTDKYPNIPAFKKIQSTAAGDFSYSEDSVNVMSVPDSLTGVRTIFSAFHHFPPEMAVDILGDAVKNKKPIAVFELSNRKPSAFLQVMLGGPIALFFMTPFLRPLRVGRFIFTYLIPLVPFFAMWDGVGSNLRAYEPGEMRELIVQVPGSDQYEWEVGTEPGEMKGIWVTYLMGSPK
jgi:hypothetical protein